MVDTNNINHPIVSIVVPVYNAEKYLSKCIDSILCQDFKNFEALLVDDGSTDGSGKICDGYKVLDSRIKVIHQRQGGAISSRMAGINASRGEYIAFVDSDDWIEGNMLSVLLNSMFNDSEVDISVSPHIRNDGGTENTIFVTRSAEVWASREAIRYMYSNKWFSWTMCGKVYRRFLFDGVEINYPDNAYGEDIEWNAKLFAKARKVSYQPVFLYHYLQHSDSMVHQFGNTERLVSIDRIKDILDSYRNVDDGMVSIMARMLCTTGVDNLIDVLQYCDDLKLSDVSKYQDIIREAYPLISDPLSNTQHRCYEYALMEKEQLKDKLSEMGRCLVSECGEFIRKHGGIFIYGAGKIADEVAGFMQENALNFEGFVVSQDVEGMHRDKIICNYKKVLTEYGEDCGFILGLNEKNSKQVIDVLNEISASWINVGRYSLHY